MGKVYPISDELLRVMRRELRKHGVTLVRRCSGFDHICLGWGEVMVYRIENDSLVFDHTEIIE